LQLDGWAADEGTCFLTLDYVPCDSVIFGCTDSTAINYNPWATFDDGSCEYETLCDAHFEVTYIDSLNSVVYIENWATGDNISYLWDFGDGTTSTQEFPVHEYNDQGTYVICLSIISNNVPNGFCTATHCDTISFDLPGILPAPFWINVLQAGTTVSLEENFIQDLNVYPNPAVDVLNVQFTRQGNDVFTIDLLDVTGRQLAMIAPKQSISRVQEIIDVSAFESGIYYLRVRNKDYSNTTRFTIVR